MGWSGAPGRSARRLRRLRRRRGRPTATRGWRSGRAAGRVRAASAPATASTPADTTPPSAPAGLTATAASATQIALSWTASTDDVAVTGYVVERCPGAECNTFTPVAAASGTTYSDTGLAPSTSYSYQVRAGDAAGNARGAAPGGGGANPRARGAAPGGGGSAGTPPDDASRLQG